MFDAIQDEACGKVQMFYFRVADTRRSIMLKTTSITYVTNGAVSLLFICSSLAKISMIKYFCLGFVGNTWVAVETTCVTGSRPHIQIC